MRAPNASLLARRDPASLAILGLAPSTFGSQFAGEFGDDYGDDYGDDVGDIAAEIGAEFGDEVGAAVARRVARKSAPNPQAMAAWNKAKMEQARSQRRASILNPNAGSQVKVERYAFSMSQPIVIGTGVALAITDQPATTIRPQRVTMNAPSTNFAFIHEIKVANVSVTVGSGAEDAFNYNAQGVGQSLDMPTLSPANRATVLGTYSGYVPPGFIAGMATNFTVTFRGPASVIA